MGIWKRKERRKIQSITTTGAKSPSYSQLPGRNSRGADAAARTYSRDSRTAFSGVSPGCKVLLGLLLAVHGMHAERVDFVVSVSMPESVSYPGCGRFPCPLFLLMFFSYLTSLPFGNLAASHFWFHGPHAWSLKELETEMGLLPHRSQSYLQNTSSKNHQSLLEDM